MTKDDGLRRMTFTLKRELLPPPEVMDIDPEKLAGEAYCATCRQCGFPIGTRFRVLGEIREDMSMAEFMGLPVRPMSIYG